MLLLISLALAGEGDDAYLLALRAWDATDWPAALEGARAARALEADHRPAALLEGYALLRLGRKDEASAVLQELAARPADEPAEREVQRRAERAWRRYEERFARELVQLDVFGLTGPQIAYDTLRGRGGWGAAATVALPGPVDVRAAGSALFTEGGLFDVSGARADLLAVGRLPLGRGVWTADLALGPSLWNATGNYWPERAHVYGGLRVAGGIDVRPAWRFGLRAEVGGQHYFGAADLPHTFPMDVRLGLTTWLGGTR